MPTWKIVEPDPGNVPNLSYNMSKGSMVVLQNWGLDFLHLYFISAKKKQKQNKAKKTVEHLDHFWNR